MLSIIVLSSDGYSDCWEPFFFLLKKNFTEAEKYEIILSTNLKKFEYSGLNLKTLAHGEDAQWSKRLKLSLNYASNEIVMVLVEDFFILSKINTKIFDNLLMMITNNDKIDHIRLLYKLDKVKTLDSEYKFLDKIATRSNYRFLYLPGLWKKKVLQKYIVNFETPYMAEKMGIVRSWILKDGFYAISNNYIKKNGRLYDCSTSGAIIKGKWEKWLPERLEENDIYIDFNIRGFRDEKTLKKNKNQIYMNLIKSPLTTFKSFFSIIIMYFNSLANK